MNYYNTQSQPTFSQPNYGSFHTPTQMLGNYITNSNLNPSNSITWVQGEAAARSFPVVTPNTSILLMDSEGNTFYIKTTDASGMPLPLRIFDYSERETNVQVESVSEEVNTKENVEESPYVTKDEFEIRMKEIVNRIKKSELKKRG